MNMSKSIRVTRVMNSVVAGTSDQNSSSVDMKGFDSVQFMLSLGVITSNAVTSFHLATSSDNSSFNDLLGTSITIADDDDNKVVFSDLASPRERYIRAVVDRGTQNCVLDGIVAFQYLPKLEPVTHGSTVAGFELHTSPSEGSP